MKKWWVWDHRVICVCTSLTFLKQGTDAHSTGRLYCLVLLVFRCVRIARGAPTVCPHVSVRLPLVVCSWSLTLQTLIKLYRETPNFVTTGQKYRTLYMNIIVRCIIDCDRKSPYKRCVRLKLCQAVRQTRNLGVRRVQPTRRDVSRFIYFCKMLYMFQTVFFSPVHHQELKTAHTASGICQTNTATRC